MSKEQDKLFFRNFSFIVGVLTLMMVIFIIVARVVGIDDEAELERRAGAVSERTAPMGDVSVAGEIEETAESMATEDEKVMDPDIERVASDEDATASDGKTTYDGVCFACHGTGIPGIPQFGDIAAWAPRIERGKDLLYKHAIEGFTGSGGMMPPKGGRRNLSDDAVKAAVDYMVANSQ